MTDAKEHPEDNLIEVCVDTQIDLLWDTLTDADKIGFAEMMREAAMEERWAPMERQMRYALAGQLTASAGISYAEAKKLVRDHAQPIYENGELVGLDMPDVPSP